MLRNLSRRDLQPEVMDQPDLDRGRHETALDGLERVNVVSRSASAVWRPIAEYARRHALRELTICDLASGGGDVALGVVLRGRRDGIRVRLLGYDVSATAVERARAKAAAAGLDADFQVRDLFTDELGGPFDVVTSSLFLHHLDEGQAVDLLTKMRGAARRLLVLNDLVRSRIGYTAAQVVCRILTRSDVVRFDGPQSVAAAFRIDEVRQLADRAGLRGATIRKVWPFRFVLTWESSE